MEYLKNTTSELIKDIALVEEKYKCQFVGDFCLKGRHGGYVTDIAAIFWQETPPVEGYSNYFGLIYRDGALYITSGAGAFDNDIIGIRDTNGDITYSRHRHDYRSSPDGVYAIDGGRDYARIIGGNNGSMPEQVQLKVVGPLIEVHSLRNAKANAFNDDPGEVDIEAELAQLGTGPSLSDILKGHLASE